MNTSSHSRRPMLPLALVVHQEFVAHDAHELLNLLFCQRFRHQPIFFVANRCDLDASCIHRFCISTCCALPKPLRLTNHIVAEASKCRFDPHDIPMSFVMLSIPSPSVAVCGGSARSRRKTAIRLAASRSIQKGSATSHDDPSRHGSPPQSASEYASNSSLCCQRNQYLALGLPTRYRPILLTRSTSRMVDHRVAQSPSLAFILPLHGTRCRGVIRSI